MRNNPELDNPLAATAISFKSPFLEYESLVDHLEASDSLMETFSKQYPEFDQSCSPFIQLGRVIPRPRTLRTHMPFPLLSATLLDKGKVVYVIRDPRDVCLSYFHHCRLWTYHDFQGTLDQFIDAFIGGTAVLFGPYWQHVREAWSRRHHPHLFITYYEKLKSKQKQKLLRLNSFFGSNVTHQQIEKIMEYTSFEEMKSRKNHILSSGSASSFVKSEHLEKEGGFFRKGEAGDWRKDLTEEQKLKFSRWIQENCPDQEIMDNIINP
uniref:Sulfotransferase 1A1-like n=1 Tax=Hirondellea gigas TaxID=1518452 RepID=A0A2P2I9U3_9CRUS